MKNNQSNKNKYFIYSILLVALVLISSVTFGQAPPPPPPPPPPPGVPFGAVELLLVGLAGYGAKNFFNKEK